MTNKLTPEELEEARSWIKDCPWGDLIEEDANELTGKEIEAGINRHYSGGVDQFKKDCV